MCKCVCKMQWLFPQRKQKQRTFFYMACGGHRRACCGNVDKVRRRVSFLGLPRQKLGSLKRCKRIASQCGRLEVRSQEVGRATLFEQDSSQEESCLASFSFWLLPAIFGISRPVHAPLKLYGCLPLCVFTSLVLCICPYVRISPS